MQLTQPNAITIILQPNMILTVMAGLVSTGNIYRLGDQQGEQGTGAIPVTASSTHNIGPFPQTSRFLIVATSGTLTITTGPVDTGAYVTDAIDDGVLLANPLILSLPTTDPLVAGALWSDTGTVKASAGPS